MSTAITASQILALIGPAILALFAFSFFYAWTFDRRRYFLLLFCLSFALYCLGAASQILLLPRNIGQNTMFSAVVYGASSWLAADAMLRRTDERLGWFLPLVILGLMISGVYYYLYIDRSLVMRVYIMNFAMGTLFLITGIRLFTQPRDKLSERVLFWVFIAFALHFFLRTLLFMDVSNTTNLETFSRSAFWLTLQISLAILGVALGLALLAATMIDIMDSLRDERDIDTLTGLLNRRSFEERATALLSGRRRQPISLIVCDLDHFKSINDSYGHAAGDAVLRDVGDILMRAARTDDLVGRVGGEEFVVLLRYTAMAGTREFTERLRKRIADRRFAELPDSVSVTASFGIAEHKPGEELWDLFARADTMLYVAKNAGRNLARFEPV